MCLAWAYWPPAAATVDVTSESIIATAVYRRPTTQHAISPASGPPLSIAKFQPVNSPTRTMPTPNAHPGAGPKTRRREIFGAGAAGAAAIVGVASIILAAP